MNENIQKKKFLTVFKRPSSTEGVWSWITTVDHKRIGIMYGYAAFFFLLFGGLEALLLRIQLAKPDNDFLSAAEYNAMFTMHGTTMVFFKNPEICKLLILLVAGSRIELPTSGL